MTNIIGVDVGFDGAVAYLGDTVEYISMPVLDRAYGKLDFGCIGAFLGRKKINKVIIESQWTIGIEGRTSLARLMVQFGQLEGWFRRSNNVELVHPKVWEKAMGIRGKHNRKSTLPLATEKLVELYPDLVLPKKKALVSGVADAILIALYGRDTAND